MRKAWTTAALKIGIGFFVVAGLLGIRIVTAVPDPASLSTNSDGTTVDSVERSDQHEGTAAKAVSGSETASSADSNESAGPGERPVRRDGDRLVSCALPRGSQFMTDDDCAMRGGTSTLFESQR